MQEMCTKFQSEGLKGKVHLEDPDIDVSNIIYEIEVQRNNWLHLWNEDKLPKQALEYKPSGIYT
jgi:hypothetical protein